MQLMPMVIEPTLMDHGGNGLKDVDILVETRSSKTHENKSVCQTANPKRSGIHRYYVFCYIVIDNCQIRNLITNQTMR